MSLLFGLVLRLLAVSVLCLAVATAWIIADTNKSMHMETVASADRAARMLKRQQWLGSARGSSYKQPFSARQALAISAALGPGICIEFSPGVGPNQRHCSSWDSFGPTAPPWFASVFGSIFDPGQPVRRAVTFNGEEVSSVIATADRVAAMTWTWGHVRIVAGTAAAIVAGMTILSALLIAHVLFPIETIIQGLRQLEGGNHASRLPGFRTSEFRRIAEAFNGMAGRLEDTVLERKALMRRLFQVQEDERKALARELHDEFGQCLTAVGALAASIQAGSPEKHPDLADDARRISVITAEMMATLKGAFSRLRPPDLDQLGLEASLRTMVRGWNSMAGPRPDFRLEVGGDLAGVPTATALSAYRIAQECITNAARHGSPSQVIVRVNRQESDENGLAVVVEDDGGGTPDRLSSATGFGILGIRERIGAIGGTLSFGRSANGLRVSAFLPL